MNIEILETNWNIITTALDFANKAGAFDLQKSYNIYLAAAAVQNEIAPLIKAQTETELKQE